MSYWESISVLKEISFHNCCCKSNCLQEEIQRPNKDKRYVYFCKQTQIQAVSKISVLVPIQDNEFVRNKGGYDER
jgi:hypothetical protein